MRIEKENDKVILINCTFVLWNSEETQSEKETIPRIVMMTERIVVETVWVLSIWVFTVFVFRNWELSREGGRRRRI